jgi:DNA-binding GntR family transcriptional regulator
MPPPAPAGRTVTPVDAEPSGAASLRIASDLREAILAGELAPGERIRQEVVAERSGASRLPVREALRMLEAEGLVEQEPNKGARVAKLDRQELDGLYRIRERIEPLALAESIPHLRDDVLDRLDAIQDEIERTTDPAHFLVLDRELHLLTYSGCPIEQLSTMTTRLWNSTQHYRRAFVTLAGADRMWVVNAEHRLILDAIRRRDTEDAERFLAGHIRRTRIELQAHAELFPAG